MNRVKISILIASMFFATMLTATIFTGLQQAKAEDNNGEKSNRDQKNKCETTHKNSAVDCKNHWWSRIIIVKYLAVGNTKNKNCNAII